ncbi:MAG: hypothetical protein P4L90_23460 [Rhodopila sp.]|nr:hypothetical protein [Rhodopila sp.]
MLDQRRHIGRVLTGSAEPVAAYPTATSGDDGGNPRWPDNLPMSFETAASTLCAVDREIASGRQADIVALPRDPFIDIAATAQFDFVMKAGQIYRHGSRDKCSANLT